MRDDLVDIFEAETLVEAKLLADRLEEAGIQFFLDNVDSPLDGLTAANQVITVRVLPADKDRAQEIAGAFLSESMEDVDFGDIDESDE